MTADLTCPGIERGTSRRRQQQHSGGEFREDFFFGLPHLSHSHKAHLCIVARRSAHLGTRAALVEECE